MQFDKQDMIQIGLAVLAGFAIGAIGGYYVLSGMPAAPVTAPAATTPAATS